MGRKERMTKTKAAGKLVATSPARKTKAEPAPGRARHARARRNVKISDMVALDIVRDIVARRLQPGDKLPLEPELLNQYRVSRSSLREALRLLEVQGLIHTRPGPGGGSVVGKVEVLGFGRTLTLHMHLIGATYSELLATYVLAEAVLAGEAAKNADRERVRQLMEPYIAGGAAHVEHPVSEGWEFHDTVARLAGNRVLSFLLLAPGSIVNEHIVTSLRREALEDKVIHDHADIAAAIIAGDSASSYRLMHEHVEYLVELFRAYWPERVGGTIEWR
jgi:GntR family transcriptional regulator, transcriptional repressor for pyruvate dehydrogenase complex